MGRGNCELLSYFFIRMSSACHVVEDELRNMIRHLLVQTYCEKNSRAPG